MINANPTQVRISKEQIRYLKKYKNKENLDSISEAIRKIITIYLNEIYHVKIKAYVKV
jgi:hypothetical protein